MENLMEHHREWNPGFGHVYEFHTPGIYYLHKICNQVCIKNVV